MNFYKSGFVLLLVVALAGSSLEGDKWWQRKWWKKEKVVVPGAKPVERRHIFGAPAVVREPAPMPRVTPAPVTKPVVRVEPEISFEPGPAEGAALRAMDRIHEQEAGKIALINETFEKYKRLSAGDSYSRLENELRRLTAMTGRNSYMVGLIESLKREIGRVDKAIEDSGGRIRMKIMIGGAERDRLTVLQQRLQEVETAYQTAVRWHALIKELFDSINRDKWKTLEQNMQQITQAMQEQERRDIHELQGLQTKFEDFVQEMLSLSRYERSYEYREIDDKLKRASVYLYSKKPDGTTVRRSYVAKRNRAAAGLLLSAADKGIKRLKGRMAYGRG